MKLILQIIATAILCYLVQQFLPWWSIQLCAAVVAFLIPNTIFKSFWGGFVSVSLLWIAYATMQDIQSQSLLTQKILPEFHLHNTASLILITGLIGGIAGGLGATCGQTLRRLLFS